MRPYLRQWTPPAFSATLPPMVQAICDDGIRRVVQAVRARPPRRSRGCARPAATTAVRRQRVDREDPRRLRQRQQDAAPRRAWRPPDRPVPAPRATTGTRAVVADLEHRDDLRLVLAAAPPRPACARYSVRPSHSYGRVSSSAGEQRRARQQRGQSGRTEASSIGSRLRVADGSLERAGVAPARRGTVPIIPHRRPPATAPGTGLAARALRRPAADGAIQPGQGFLRMLRPSRAPRDSSRTRSPCTNEEYPRMRTSRLFAALPRIDRRGAAAGRAGRRADRR